MAGTKQSTKAAEAASGKLLVVTSSEARRNWSKITRSALAGERIAILVGTQALALKPVELTYAEKEYGVKPSELHDKAAKVLVRARKERATGKSGKFTGKASDLL